MSGPKMVSERDAVLRERAAYFEGASFQEHRHRADLRSPAIGLGVALNEAAVCYPLPKVERPRELTSLATTVTYRVVEGTLQADEGGWFTPDYLPVADLELVTSLLANPTELVDDNGALPLSGTTGGDAT